MKSGNSTEHVWRSPAYGGRKDEPKTRNQRMFTFLSPTRMRTDRAQGERKRKEQRVVPETGQSKEPTCWNVTMRKGTQKRSIFVSWTETLCYLGGFGWSIKENWVSRKFWVTFKSIISGLYAWQFFKVPQATLFASPTVLVPRNINNQILQTQWPQLSS